MFIKKLTQHYWIAEQSLNVEIFSDDIKQAFVPALPLSYIVAEITVSTSTAMSIR